MSTKITNTADTALILPKIYACFVIENNYYITIIYIENNINNIFIVEEKTSKVIWGK